MRDGQWKLILAPDSGGWTSPRPGSPEARGLPRVQLYDMETDVGESTNVASAHPDVVTRLTGMLERSVESGRSTPGAPQANAVGVDVQKFSRAR